MEAWIVATVGNDLKYYLKNSGRDQHRDSSYERGRGLPVGGRQGTCSCCSRDKIRFLWVMTIVGSGHVPSPPNLLLGFPEYLTRATPGGCSEAPGRWSWTKKSVNDCWLLLLLRPDLCSAILQPSAITHPSQLHPLLSDANCASARYAPSVDDSQWH